MVLDLKGLSRNAPTFADCLQPCMVHFAHKGGARLHCCSHQEGPADEDKQHKTPRRAAPHCQPSCQKVPDRRSCEACLALLLKSKKSLILIGGCKGQDGVTLFFPPTPVRRLGCWRCTLEHAGRCRWLATRIALVDRSWLGNHLLALVTHRLLLFMLHSRPPP
jgi:hypothetical protein